MCLAKQDMQVIKELGSLFSKLHMVAFDSFLTIVASLQLEKKINKAHHNEEWEEYNYNDNIVLTARCSSHHSSEQPIVCFASSHPRPVAQFLKSINVEYSFLRRSNLFFNCFFVLLSLD